MSKVEYRRVTLWVRDGPEDGDRRIPRLDITKVKKLVDWYEIRDTLSAMNRIVVS
ncbi:hypothetical protein [Erythrobacter sp. QSSC1-22B]|uniref:hypothetical protein n=1 Tax=Erythrobacter sp. QSSC1-22B TaxID=1860125 RepID=UPI001439FFBB|nr:hypothetical protein [Erythrobacter sp. QSSC1-22B]